MVKFVLIKILEWDCVVFDLCFLLLIGVLVVMFLLCSEVGDRLGMIMSVVYDVWLLEFVLRGYVRRRCCYNG